MLEVNATAAGDAAAVPVAAAAAVATAVAVVGGREEGPGNGSDTSEDRRVIHRTRRRKMDALPYPSIHPLQPVSCLLIAHNICFRFKWSFRKNHRNRAHSRRPKNLLLILKQPPAVSVPGFWAARMLTVECERETE